jgi:predicted DCC family thiol-disulfide oxidoreductase YuxK
MNPGWVFLYDGHCRFCVGSAARMRSLTRPGVLTLRDFQKPGVLAEYPALTFEQCMRQAQLVAPDGRIFEGMEAVVRALMTRPLLGAFARLYYVPGIHQVANAFYAGIAANRYRLFGRTAAGACDDDACAVHLGTGRESRPAAPRPEPSLTPPPR